MKKIVPPFITPATFALGLAISSYAVRADELAMTTTELVESVLEQSEYPLIKRQPADQGVWLGANVTFSVTAENGDGYQWVRNGVILPGQTNSTLTIEQATVEDVGVYTAYIFKGEEAVPTRGASLNTYSMLSGGDGIVIDGPVYSAMGGSGGSCPGPYVGFASYIKPSPAWGWAPSSGTTVHTATDTNRTDTYISYLGRYYDTGCATNSVTVPNPPVSPKYRFTVFFPNNLPTNAYSIVLTGFNP